MEPYCGHCKSNGHRGEDCPTLVKADIPIGGALIRRTGIQLSSLGRERGVKASTGDCGSPGAGSIPAAHSKPLHSNALPSNKPLRSNALAEIFPKPIGHTGQEAAKHCPTCTCESKRIHPSKAAKQRAYRKRVKP
jgi:hypothetical protein